MRYTASAIGLLTRQYKSVLKKCFLINMGLFALGAVSANAAVPTPTLDKLHAQDPITYPNPSAYKYIEGAAGNYDVKVDSDYAIIGLKDEIKDEKVKIDWSDKLDADPYAGQSPSRWANDYIAGSNVTVNGNTITGAIRLQMPHNNVIPTTWNRWYTYTYTKPSGYEITQTRLSGSDVTADNVNQKVFAGIKKYEYGAAIYISYQDLSTIDIISDFIVNSHSSSYAYGGAIYNNEGKIKSIMGDFIGNYAIANTQIANGGAIFNRTFNGEANINNINGNFIGNSALSLKNGTAGGAIFIEAAGSSGKTHIESIVGDFIGNYAIGQSTDISGGAIYNNSKSGANSTIVSIVGDFIGNTATVIETASNYTYSKGGAITNSTTGDGTTRIDSIVGNFVGNKAISSNLTQGGAILNYNANIGSIEGNFIGNFSLSTQDNNNAIGGAIDNDGNNSSIIGSIKGDFIGNFAKTTSSTKKAYGGAIYNARTYGGAPQYNGNLIITLDGNTFTDNYVQVGDTVTPNSIYNAGIINIADNATVTVNDGWQSIDDSSGTGQLVMGSGSALNMNIGNGTVQEDSLGNITNVGTINATVDLNLTDIAAPTSDTITVSSATQPGYINLTGLNFKGDYNTYKGHEFTKRILINSNGSSDLQLKIAMATSDDKYVLMQGKKTAYSDEFGGTAKWTDTYESYNLSTDIVGDIVTTDGTTTNDSITFTVTGKQETKSDVVSDGDTLRIVNQSDKATRSFNATTDGESYKVRDDIVGGGLGSADAGTININGKPDGASANGTIDLNGKTGFELDKATTLNINDTDISNAKVGTDVINASSADAVVNLNNSVIDGTVTNAGEVTLTNSAINGNVTNSGELNLADNATLGGKVIGTGDNAVMNVNSDFELASTVTNHNINVNNSATLTVASAGSLVGSDTLNAVGGTVDLGNNAVNVKSAALDGNSTLVLKINSLADHGSLTATDSITINDGAKLKATLAQGVDLGDVTLLSAPTHTGDFADEDVSHVEDGVTVEDNNMYKFLKKEGKFGVFTIAQKATAEEIATEAGAEPWAASAAGAFVDGEKFAESTVSADVANKLADLAQNDAIGLVDAVKSIAPTETAVVQAQSTEEASRLFKTVDAYLRGERSPMGFASGDDLDGVSVWGKAYIGESKISRRGKVDGSDADSKGFIIGLEKKLNKEVKVGAGVQYDNTDIDAYRRDIDVDSVQGFVYGEYKPSNWFVNGVLSYGGSKYDEKKYALGTHYDAKYDAHIASVAAMTGYQYGIFTPEAGLRYYHIKQSGYTDTAGQNVEEDKSDILRGVAGVRMAKDFGKYRPEAYLGITYDLASDKGNTTVNLANGSSYTVQGKRLDKLGYEASLSFAASLNENITASVSYLGAYRDNYREHTGMFNVKYNF